MNKSDKEIIDQAVAGILEMEDKRQREIDADVRKEVLIQEVIRRTGASWFDASRYVSYAMGETPIDPRDGLGAL